MIGRTDARFLMFFLALFAFAEEATAGVGRVGVAASGLTNVAQVLLPAVPIRTLSSCTIQGGAANQVVIFRPVGGGTAYATVNVAAGAVVGRSLNAAIPAGGLEVVTQGAAGDVTVECLYRFGP